MDRIHKNIKSFLNAAPIICALLVICIHAYNAAGVSPESITARVQGFLSHGICLLAVPVFLFLSGYLFFRDADTIQSVWKKQQRRIKTLLIPFLAWSVAYWVVYTVGNGGWHVLMKNSVGVFVLGAIRDVVFYAHYFPLWYMFQLILYVLLAPAIYYVLKSKTATISLIALMVLLAYTNNGEINIQLGTLERTLFHFNFFGYFLAGCLLGKEQTWMEALVKFAQKIPFWVILAVFVVCSYVESLLFDHIIPSHYSRLLAPLIFVVGMVLLLKLTDRWHVGAVSWCSTMVVYGVHGVVGLVVGKVIGQILPVNVLLQFFLGFAITTVLSFAISFIMKRWLKPLHLIFSGFR